MATTTNPDVEAVPAQTAQAPSRTRSQTQERLLRVLRRAWQARGLFGGLGAIWLGWLGQSALLTRGDGAAAFRYYALAVALLILSLLHPSIEWMGRLRARTARPEGLSEAPPAAAEPSPAVESVPADAGVSVRKARAAVRAPAVRPVTRIEEWRARYYPWTRYVGVRERLGWKATAAGLALTAILGGTSAIILAGNPINDASPLGGWLWAFSLLTLFLTFAGAPAWPRGEGLLPTPEREFFRNGMPRIPARVEAALVAVVLAVALFMRLWDLEQMPGIFGDEGERGMDVRAIMEGRPANIFHYGWWGVPNLFFYLMVPFMRVLGDGMVAARMLSVVSGLITVWFVYKTGRLLWGQRAGLIAGAVMAAQPVALQFSRQAGESTPTGALWATGFYFLFMALRYRRWTDWLLAGFAWGFSLYFYAAGKLIIPLAAVVALYCLVRWHKHFFKRYVVGWALLAVAFGLTFMPYGIFSAKDNWQGFSGRASETSIFSPYRQQEAFAKHGIPYRPAGSSLDSLPTRVLRDAGPWSRLVFEQTRVTTEVLYRSSDPTPFFQIRENMGALLNPLLAVLAILGIAYALWKIVDARYGIVSLWFWGGLMGAALTMDTPSVQRMVGAWPALMLFPAIVLDRVIAAGWPLSRRFSLVWSALPLAALLVYFAADGYRVYFDHYRSLCPFCDATTQARYVQDLGQEYKGYQLGVGGYDAFFTYGSTRYIAKGVEGVDLTVPADYLPVTDEGKGAAFIVYSNNAEYLPLLRLFYPEGVEEEVKSPDGVTRFTSYKVTREQIEAHRKTEARITLPDGVLFSLPTPAFGVLDEPAIRRTGEQGAQYPAPVSWRAAVFAPSYGVYTFAVKGRGDARLEIDGRVVVDEEEGQIAPAEVVFARGMHDIVLSGTYAPGAAVDLRWGTGSGTLAPVPARFIYDGPSGGLSGEFAALSTLDQMQAADPLGPGPRFLRRSDLFFGFREATNSVGATPFAAWWRGKLVAPRDGNYAFEIASNGPGVVIIDGEAVVNNTSSGNIGRSGGQIELSQGEHDIELRYAWLSGRATLELFWVPPGGERTLIPPTALRPAARSWTRAEVPDAPVPQMPGSREAEVKALKPLQVFGNLSRPRGLAVDSQGNVYVGDRGTGRVVVFGPDGREITAWGQPVPEERRGAPGPGEFVNISDLAIGPDGTVFVMDEAANRVQLFTPDGTFKAALDAGILNTSVPNGIDVAPDGTLYVASTAQSEIAAFAVSGVTEENAGAVAASRRGLTGGAVVNRIEQPLDVVASPTSPGTVYVADLRDRIARLDAEGNVTAEWPLFAGREEGGGRLAISPDAGTLYLSVPDRHHVAVLRLSDGSLSYFGQEGSGEGEMVSPGGIAVGPEGRVYVLDRGNGRVQVFEPAP